MGTFDIVYTVATPDDQSRPDVKKEKENPKRDFISGPRHGHLPSHWRRFSAAKRLFAKAHISPTQIWYLILFHQHWFDTSPFLPFFFMIIMRFYRKTVTSLQFQVILFFKSLFVLDVGSMGLRAKFITPLPADFSWAPLKHLKEMVISKDRKCVFCSVWSGLVWSGLVWISV